MSCRTAGLCSVLSWVEQLIRDDRRRSGCRRSAARFRLSESCPLGKIGHPRDGVKGRLQIVYGLLCTTEGRPIAIEVFDGNTADPKTLAAQIKALVEADAMQLSLFDEHNQFQITHPDYPSERPSPGLLEAVISWIPGSSILSS